MKCRNAMRSSFSSSPSQGRRASDCPPSTQWRVVHNVRQRVRPWRALCRYRQAGVVTAKCTIACRGVGDVIVVQSTGTSHASANAAIFFSRPQPSSLGQVELKNVDAPVPGIDESRATCRSASRSNRCCRVVPNPSRPSSHRCDRFLKVKHPIGLEGLSECCSRMGIVAVVGITRISTRSPTARDGSHGGYRSS